MNREINEKISDFSSLIFTLILDALLVVFVALLTYFVRYVIEKHIYHCGLENINNGVVKAIYGMSEFFVVAIFCIYVICDLVIEVIRILKKMKHERDI